MEFNVAGKRSILWKTNRNGSNKIYLDVTSVPFEDALDDHMVFRLLARIELNEEEYIALSNAIKG